jgi:hypothetical protein
MKHFFGHCLALNLGVLNKLVSCSVNELMALNGVKHLRSFQNGISISKYQDKSLDILKPAVELGEN